MKGKKKIRLPTRRTKLACVHMKRGILLFFWWAGLRGLKELMFPLCCELLLFDTNTHHRCLRSEEVTFFPPSELECWPRARYVRSFHRFDINPLRYIFLPFFFLSPFFLAPCVLDLKRHKRYARSTISFFFSHCFIFVSLLVVTERFAKNREKIVTFLYCFRIECEVSKWIAYPRRYFKPIADPTPSISQIRHRTIKKSVHTNRSLTFKSSLTFF